MMRYFLAGLIGLVASLLILPPAVAAAKSEQPAMESVLTARLDGWLIIDSDGSVLDLGIETDVPVSLRESLDRTVRRWRFHPVVIDGEVRRAKSRMRITLAAVQEGEGDRIKVGNAIFPSPADTSVTGIVDNRSAIISRRSLLTPGYPPELISAGVTGIVQLVIRVGPDGRTAEVLSRQTALHDVKGTDFVMRKAAELMEDSAVRAATGWTFNVQLRTETPDPSDLTVTVPVVYILDEPRRRRDQTASEVSAALWRAEVRTALRSVPWLAGTEGEKVAGASDLRDGEMFPAADWIHFAENGVGDSLL